VKQTTDWGNGAMQVTFSILERMGAGKRYLFSLRRTSVVAFSILERIEVGETTIGLRKNVQHIIFQYPRTDRSG